MDVSEFLSTYWFLILIGAVIIFWDKIKTYLGRPEKKPVTNPQLYPGTNISEDMETQRQRTLTEIEFVKTQRKSTLDKIEELKYKEKQLLLKQQLGMKNLDMIEGMLDQQKEMSKK